LSLAKLLDRGAKQWLSVVLTHVEIIEYNK